MKRIIITENQKEDILERLDENDIPKQASKPYTINPDKVLMVKKYLDSSIKRGKAERVGANGFPEIRRMYGMMSSDGDILKALEQENMEDLLIEKFKKMFLNDDERSKFMKQVLKDWYDNKINMFGGLSVNHL